MQDLCYENKFDLHENEPVGATHFHMNGFARRLVLTEGKWPIKQGFYFVQFYVTAAGLKIILNGERWPVILTDQTNFSSVMSRF